MGKVVVSAAVKPSECSGKQKPMALVVTARTWARSSRNALGTGSGDSVLEGCAGRLHTAVSMWPGNKVRGSLLKSGPSTQTAVTRA